MSRTVYTLSGGGTVEVHTPFGNAYYLAVVIQDGRYPEKGKIARNKGRQEYSVILEGEFCYRVGGEPKTLGVNDSILVPADVDYTLDGRGKILVFVHDEEGGTTIVTEAPS